MYLNRRHSKFDLAMELLALLPSDPYTIPLKLIIVDLGFEKQHEVGFLLRELTKRRFRISTRNSFHGRSAYCYASGWEDAKCAAKRYMGIVYGPCWSWQERASIKGYGKTYATV